ncbi:hypothetical protein HmCmsJML024_01813 [Escherichia coli]|nr:hypothetical protein HmCmsJML024_01813 [Escherichia coli]
MQTRWIFALIIALLAPGAAANHFANGRTVCPGEIQQRGAPLPHTPAEVYQQQPTRPHVQAKGTHERNSTESKK